MPLVSIAGLRARIGEETGTSSWICLDQHRIDQFADATEDKQFIHTDPEAAAAAGLGGTIAHGFLSLSLLSRMGAEAMLVPEDARVALNYGFDRIRFLAPVAAGKRVRGHFRLDSVDERGEGQYLLSHEVTVEIEGEGKPALIATWLSLFLA